MNVNNNICNNDNFKVLIQNRKFNLKNFEYYGIKYLCNYKKKKISRVLAIKKMRYKKK